MRQAGRALVLLLTALFLSLPGLALAVDEANMDQLAIDLGLQTGTCCHRSAPYVISVAGALLDQLCELARRDVDSQWQRRSQRDIHLACAA